MSPRMNHRQWLNRMLARAELRIREYTDARDYEMLEWWRTLSKALQRRARRVSAAVKLDPRSDPSSDRR